MGNLHTRLRASIDTGYRFLFQLKSTEIKEFINQRIIDLSVLQQVISPSDLMAMKVSGVRYVLAAGEKGIFLGHMENGKPQYGIFFFDDGRRYMGEFSADTLNGSGILCEFTEFTNSEKRAIKCYNGFFDSGEPKVRYTISICDLIN